MKKLCRMMTVTLLTLSLALTGVFAQAAVTGSAVTVYGAQKLVYLNQSYVNIVPGDAYKLNLYSGKKNISAKAKWTSSKSSVVSVNKKGRIKAKTNGKAVITASYGDKTLKCTVTSAYKDYEELYHDTLNAMYNRIYGWGDSSDALAGGFVGIAENIGNSTGEEALKKIGYAIMDINGDGVPELIVSGISKRGKKVCFTDDICLLYTYVDKKAVEVTSGWYRNRNRLMDDGHIFYFGSNGAMYAMFGDYELGAGGTSLVCKDFYFTSDEENDNNEIYYYHNTSGYCDVTSSERVEAKPEDFWAVNDAMDKRCRRIEVTPFSDFAVDIFSSASKDISIYDSTAGYEEYYECKADDGEYSVTTVIAANSVLTDFKISEITWKDSADYIFTYELSAEPIYSLDKLTPDKPLKLTVVFPGDMPHYAITFKDATGTEKCYALEQSGYDGSIIITDL